MENSKYILTIEDYYNKIHNWIYVELDYILNKKYNDKENSLFYFYKIEEDFCWISLIIEIKKENLNKFFEKEDQIASEIQEIINTLEKKYIW